MKARMKQSVSFRAFSVLSLAVLFFSCGIIEDDTPLDAPTSLNAVAVNSSESTERYFSFLSINAPPDPESTLFLGTTVYYRIYNNETDRSTDAASISYANTAYSPNGFHKMASLGYERLECESLDGTRSSFLVEDSKEVYIRLYTEGTAEDMLAGIRIGNSSAPRIVIPLRSVKGRAFNFYRTAYNPNDDVLPELDELDVKYTSFTIEDTWFVNAYAVSVGLSTSTLAPTYSQLLHLGSIQIEKP